MANKLLNALDADIIDNVARIYDSPFGMGGPTGHPYEDAEASLIEDAVKPFASNPDLRARLIEMQARHEQAIDDVSVDAVIEAGFTDEASRLLVQSFEEFIAEHKDEITALQILYSIPQSD